jgi:hypothetical protein
MRAEELVDMRNRRFTDYYWGNGLNVMRPMQTVVIEGAHDRNGKVMLSTKNPFAPGSFFRALRDKRCMEYVIGSFAGNKWGVPFGKRYAIERRDGEMMTLDDYKTLRKGAIIWSILSNSI